MTSSVLELEDFELEDMVQTVDLETFTNLAQTLLKPCSNLAQTLLKP